MRARWKASRVGELLDLRNEVRSKEGFAGKKKGQSKEIDKPKLAPMIRGEQLMFPPIVTAATGI